MGASVEHVLVKASFKDEITRRLERLEGQADKTGKSLRNMDDGTAAKRLDRTDRKARGLHSTLGKLTAAATGFDRVIANIKIPALLTGLRLAATALSGLTAAATAAIGSLAPLSGLMAAYPALGLAMLSTFGVVKAATSGLGEAVKVMTKADATAEEVAEALKDLSPAAQKFATQLAHMKKELVSVQQAAQEAVLPGFGIALEHLGGRLIPIVRDEMGSLGKIIGTTAVNLAELVGSDGFLNDLQTMLANNRVLVRRMGDALVNVVSAFRHLMVGAAPLIDWLGKGLVKGAASMERFFASTRASGELADFFRQAGRTASKTWAVFKELFMLLYNIMSVGSEFGSRMGDDLLGWLRDKNAWATSVEGVRSLTKWFELGESVMDDFIRLGKGIVDLFAGITGEGEGLSKTIDAIVGDDGLLHHIEAIAMGFDDKLGPTMVNLATAVVRFFNLLTFQPLIDLATAFANVAEKVLGFIEGLGEGEKTALAATLAISKIPIVLGLMMSMLGVGKLVTFIQTTWGMIAAMRGMEAATLSSTAAQKGHAVVTKVQVVGAWIAAKAAIIGNTVAKWANTAATWAANAASKAWAAAQWLLNAALTANPIGLIIAAIALLVTGIVVAYNKSERFRNIVQSVWEWIQRAATVVKNLFLEFTPLGRAIKAADERFGGLKGTVEAVVRAFKRAVEWAGRAVDAVSGFASGRRGGFAGRAVSWINPFGDTATPVRATGRVRGGDGASLSSTLGMHAMADAMTPGTRQITNVFRGGFAGSDHHAGRALDLQGSFLNTYRRNLAALGGWGEHHGNGSGRHLHAVYGDTARTRARTVAPSAPTGGGSTVLSLEGPLIGQVVAQSEFDLEVAVRRGIEGWIRDRNERS